MCQQSKTAVHGCANKAQPNDMDMSSTAYVRVAKLLRFILRFMNSSPSCKRVHYSTYQRQKQFLKNILPA